MMAKLGFPLLCTQSLKGLVSMTDSQTDRQTDRRMHCWHMRKRAYSLVV